MEKDQNINNKEIKKEEENSTKKAQVEENKKKQDKTKKDLSPEEKILELEDKLTRTLAEMEKHLWGNADAFHKGSRHTQPLLGSRRGTVARNQPKSLK